MVGEGIGSIFSAALGYAPTLFSYFNPSRSPYYSMTVASIVGLSVLFAVKATAWIAAFVPIGLLLVALALATIAAPKFLFTVDEYNDQLKFARSLAITTAAICIIFLACNENNPLGYVTLPDGTSASCTHCDDWLRWTILLVYLCCLVQILLFLAYAFVFQSYSESVVDTVYQGDSLTPMHDVAERTPRIAEKNYVQIALVMCAYLAGMTWVADRASRTFTFEVMTLVLFGGIWLICAVHVLLFVQRNFSLNRPIDSVVPLQSPAANVITFKQVSPADSRAGSDAGKGLPESQTR